MSLYNQATLGQPLYYYGHKGNKAFDCCDTEELYKQNLKRQPQDWYYRTNPVEYVWNANGYRAPEWRHVDWNASHLIFGCSYVAGIGVTTEHTLNHQLSQLLGEPVINLGVSAAGPTVIQFNSLRLADFRPKSVSIVVPEITRYTMFDADNPMNLVPGSLDYIKDLAYRKFYELYLAQDINSSLHGFLAIDSARALWQALGVPTYVYRFHEANPYPAELLDIIDFGRDLVPNGADWLGHPGAKTYALWAQTMFDKIRA